MPGGEAGLFGKTDVGGRADGYQNRIGGDGGTVAQLEPGRGACGCGDLVDGAY